jgi:hypothetical protein
MAIEVTMVETPWVCDRCQHAGRTLLSAQIDVVSAANRIMKDHQELSPECEGDMSSLRVLYELRRVVDDDVVQFGKLTLKSGDVLVLNCPADWRPEQVAEYYKNVAYLLAVSLDKLPMVFANGGGVEISTAHFEPDLDQLAAQLAPRMAAAFARHLAGFGVRGDIERAIDPEAT